MSICTVLPNLVNTECTKDEGGLPELLDRQETDRNAAQTIECLEQELTALYRDMKATNGEPPTFLYLRDL